MKKNFKALGSLGCCHVTSSQEGVNANLQSYRFLEHISGSFQYLFMKFIWYIGFFAVHIISLPIGALFSLERRLIVPILAIFWRLLAFFTLSVFGQTFWPSTMIILRKNQSNLCYFTCNKECFHSSNHITKN